MGTLLVALMRDAIVRVHIGEERRRDHTAGLAAALRTRHRLGASAHAGPFPEGATLVTKVIV